MRVYKRVKNAPAPWTRFNRALTVDIDNIMAVLTAGALFIDRRGTYRFCE